VFELLKDSNEGEGFIDSQQKNSPTLNNWKGMMQIQTLKELENFFVNRAIEESSKDLKKELSDKMKKWGYVIHEVPADGNCQFHALAHQLSQLGHFVDHESIRREIVKYLKCQVRS
jgi:hypothetical protein